MHASTLVDYHVPLVHQRYWQTGAPFGDPTASDREIAQILQQQEQEWSMARAQQGTQVCTSSSSATGGQYVQDHGRFHQLISASATCKRLVPRVFGDTSSSSQDTNVARRRLTQRIQVYSMLEKPVKGDGNCQFRALADQIYMNPLKHDKVRQIVAWRLKSHPELYKAYVPENYQVYCSRVATLGTWGDHVTLQAAADVFGAHVVVLTSIEDVYFVEVPPRELKTTRVLYLSYWSEVHYNSLWPSHVGIPSDKVLGSRMLGKIVQRLF